MIDETTVAQWLAALAVPADALSIGAELDDRWCLLSLPDPAGTGSTVWEVFWRQQGDRFDWARFTDEQVACYYLLGRWPTASWCSASSRRASPRPRSRFLCSRRL